MRVKVGNTWYKPEPGQPIMIELSEEDRRNLSMMHPDATRYAEFDEHDPIPVSEMEIWMDEGALKKDE